MQGGWVYNLFGSQQSAARLTFGSSLLPPSEKKRPRAQPAGLEYALLERNVVTFFYHDCSAALNRWLGGS